MNRYTVVVHDHSRNRVAEYAHDDIEVALAEVEAWAKTLAGEYSVELRKGQGLERG